MNTFRQDINELKANDYLMTAKKLLTWYNKDWFTLYHSVNEVDNIRATSMLVDFMYLDKDTINKEVINQHKYSIGNY